MREEFIKFRSKARKISGPALILYVRRAAHTRLAVVVPAKVNKSAAVRNWLKRSTYDTLWSVLKEENYDCVVVYKPIPGGKSHDMRKRITEEINDASKKLAEYGKV